MGSHTDIAKLALIVGIPLFFGLLFLVRNRNRDGRRSDSAPVLGGDTGDRKEERGLGGFLLGDSGSGNDAGSGGGGDGGG